MLKFATVSLALTLSGCKFVLLDPKGDVGIQEKELILTALGLMMIVVIPVILMTVHFAHKYRESNADNADYTPEWSESKKIELVVWAVPIAIICILATIAWRSTHQLEPSTPIAKDGQDTMTIQVVALDWQWLFIYPEQRIASINHVTFPKDVAVEFKLVADNIMNSFFIPQLGSQLYAMPGMVTTLHLVANEAGEYKGIGASYSGEGFSDMKFTALAVDDEQAFDKWVSQVRASDKSIGSFSDYRELAKPTVNAPVSYFSSVPASLFKDVVTQYPGNHNMDGMSDHRHSAASHD